MTDDLPSLSDEQCDLLTEKLMTKLAVKNGYQATDLNPDIMAHHTLRRGLVRVAYELGKVQATEACAALLDAEHEKRKHLDNLAGSYARMIRERGNE